jgi:hypothetical protein
MNENRTLIFFNFKHYQNDFHSSVPGEEEEMIKEVMTRMQKAIEEVPYQLDVTPFLDFNFFYILYDRNEKTIRWVGDNPEICVPL